MFKFPKRLKDVESATKSICILALQNHLSTVDIHPLIKHNYIMFIWCLMWKILESILESPAQGLLREERQGGGSVGSTWEAPRWLFEWGKHRGNRGKIMKKWWWTMKFRVQLWFCHKKSSDKATCGSFSWSFSRFGSSWVILHDIHDIQSWTSIHDWWMVSNSFFLSLKRLQKHCFQVDDIG